MIPNRCLLWVVVPVIAWFALWNATKLPLYFSSIPPMTDVSYDETACHDDLRNRCRGLQTQQNLVYMFDYVSPFKLMADEDLFVAPHCAMGIAIEVFLILGMLEGQQSLYALSYIFLPLVAMFALHIFPVRKGIPDSLSGAPVNELLIVLLLVAVAAGVLGMWLIKQAKREGHVDHDVKPSSPVLTGSWVAIGLLANLAPFGEWIMLFGGISSRDPAVVDLDRPHPMSGRDFYAGLNCPWLGNILTMLLIFLTFMYIYDHMEVEKRSSWRSPFNKKGPALWQFVREPAPSVDVVKTERPERYLEATGECFVLTLAICWVITSIYNPGIFKDNILKGIVGYNNLCVGFDSPPARYVAAPLLTMQAAIAGRYSQADSTRLIGTREHLTSFQFWFAYIANWIFAVHMMAFPMLLVVTAGWDSWWLTEMHLFLFMFTLFILWLMIAGNVFEAPSVTWKTKVWFTLFTLHTLLLPVVGTIDVLAFHPTWKSNDMTELKTVPHKPPVKWWICAYLDYGWFFLLLLTVVYIPDAPPLHVTYQCSMEDIGQRSSDEEASLVSSAEDSTDKNADL